MFRVEQPQRIFGEAKLDGRKGPPRSRRNGSRPGLDPRRNSPQSGGCAWDKTVPRSTRRAASL